MSIRHKNSHELNETTDVTKIILLLPLCTFLQLNVTKNSNQLIATKDDVIHVNKSWKLVHGSCYC